MYIYIYVCVYVYIYIYIYIYVCGVRMVCVIHVYYVQGERDPSVVKVHFRMSRFMSDV